MPFKGLSSVLDYLYCKPDVEKPEKLDSVSVNFNSFTFSDRILPPCKPLSENLDFPPGYFLNLYAVVKSYGTSNYKGARIPLLHNNIKVDVFRDYLVKLSYPHIHIMQYVEFIDTELAEVGLTGPLNFDPFDGIMLSPLMTAPKKPTGRRAVFDASFGIHSLNKNTPEREYHESQYEFHYPRIDDLADMNATLGRGCYLFKRDLSRYFLQLKIDPIEYDKLGFVWRQKLFFFVSFVWGCRHADYCGQWLSSAVSFIHKALGIELTGSPFNILNYADDFAGAEDSLTVAKTSFEMLGQLLSDLGL